MTRLLHDLDEAADLLSISRRVVDRLVRDGDLDSVKLGRRRLIPHDALQAYVEKLVATS
ncbi:helix-turn-helix domain-containing protein [Nocardioides sp.]|uniref:helix-turn-helix domain-containing protein n=1 Tax=Nocardioides sp. TaxID=35761 RepID=UPI00356294AC